jgi:hypothetical protein
LAIDGSEQRNLLSKLLNMRMAMIEVGITETYEEAWLRHLSTHPEDHHANVRIFNRQQSGAEPEKPRYKSSCNQRAF